MIFRGKSIFDASFDVYADNYHQVRPGYPQAMYEDIRKECGITTESRILEIGSGSGIATAELAKYGCEVVGLEPGGNLAAIAREQTSGAPAVKIVEATFEDYRADGAFDAVLALTAFHWISGAARFNKVRDLLEPHGCMVIVWNSFFQCGSLVTGEVNAAYHDLLPDLYPAGDTDVNAEVAAKLNGRVVEVQQNEDFCLTFLKRYLTVYRYDGTSYPNLLKTYPKIISLDEQRREAFLQKISEIVGRNGWISVPVQTTLLVCRRKDYFMRSIAVCE